MTHSKRRTILILVLVAAGAYLALNSAVLTSSVENEPAVQADSHEGHAHAEGEQHSEGEEPTEEAEGAHEVHDHAESEGVVDEHGHVHGAEPGEEGHVDEVQLTAEAIQANGIRLESAGQHPIGEILSVPGRVSFNTEAMAHVGTPVTGRVAEVRVKLGDEVAKGDVLFVIDSPSLGEAQSDYLQKLNQVKVAESALGVARTASERAKRLLDSKGISLAEYQKRDGELKASEGELLMAQTARIAAENNLHLWGFDASQVNQLVKTGEINPRYIVRAPIPGRVIEREATLGEMVGPDRDALLILANMEILWVLANVPEHQVHKIIVGSSAVITLDAVPDMSYTGKITYISPSLDASTRTATVRTEVRDGHTPLKPGMFAKVRLNAAGPAGGATAPMALAVPIGSVQNVEGAPSVFVEVDNEPNTFVKQNVEVGPPINGMVPILSGLEEGKRFVSNGAFILKAQLAKGEMEGKSCSGH